MFYSWKKFFGSPKRLQWKSSRSALRSLMPSLAIAGLSALALPQAGTAPATGRISQSRSVFVENRGQWDAQAKFLSQTPGTDEWITSDGAVFDFSRVMMTPLDRNRRGASHGQVIGQVVRMSFAGAAVASPVGANPLPGKFNYLIGDASNWTRNVPSYSEVKSRELYDGVAARYYIDHGTPRYDLIVQPGADPSQVRLRFEGANAVRLLPNGNLAIDTSLGTVEQRGLVAYQEEGDARRPVPCRMVTDGQSVGFDTGGYDASQPLVIDPLVFSTFVGGTNNFDFISGVRSAPGGAPVIAGYTRASNFPTSTGAYQTNFVGFVEGFVTEFNATGTQAVYSTFLGGFGASWIYGMAIDAAGEAVVTGATTTSDFPVTSGAFQTVNAGLPGSSGAFVAKLNAAGSALVFSTYLTGSGGDGNGSTADAVALDGSQNVFVTGTDGNDNFPVSKNAYQSTPKSSENAFLVKLNSTGTTLLAGSLVGGTGYDVPAALAVDADDYAYIAGQTSSNDFPTTANAYQKTNPAMNNQETGFVVRFSADASALSFSTYLGGSQNTSIKALVVNSSREAIVGGYTPSSNYPTTAGVIQPTYAANNNDQGFVTVLNDLGSGLAASTYFGATGNSAVYGLALDGAGNILVGGSTAAQNFPTTSGAYQTQNSFGINCAFLSSVTPSLKSENYSTLISGSGGQYGDQVDYVALTASGNALIAGSASSPDFPTTVNAYDSVGNVEGGVFVACMKMTAAAETGLLNFSIPGPVMSGQAISMTALLNGPAPAMEAVTLTPSVALNLQSIISIASGTNYGTAEFTVPTVTSPTQYTITASLSSVHLTRTLSVVPAAISSIQVPTGLVQNTYYSGVIEFSGIAGYNSPGKVTFSTTGPINTPSSDYIGYGQSFASFSFATNAVTVPTAAHLTAIFGNVSKTVVLNVYPSLRSFRIGPASGVGGGTFTGYVQIYAPQPYAVQAVNIQSIQYPLYVNNNDQFLMPAGATSASFNIYSHPVSTTTMCTVQIASGGTILSATVTLTPPSAMKAMRLPATSIASRGTKATVLTACGVPGHPALAYAWGGRVLGWTLRAVKKSRLPGRLRTGNPLTISWTQSANGDAFLPRPGAHFYS